MSALGSISSTQATGVNASLCTHSSARSEPKQFDSAEAQAQREQRLSDALAKAGVDDETAAAIKSDLEALFSENSSTGTERLDPKTIKSQVDEVFANYGLNASDILGRPGPGGSGGPGGPPPGGAPQGAEDSDSSTSSGDSQTLLELIQQLAEQEQDTSELAQLIVDALQGLDKFA